MFTAMAKLSGKLFRRLGLQGYISVLPQQSGMMDTNQIAFLMSISLEWEQRLNSRVYQKWLWKPRHTVGKLPKWPVCMGYWGVGELCPDRGYCNS